MADHIESSDGSLLARIDSANASSTRRFLVSHHGGGGGNELFEVYEDGSIKLHGRIFRDAPVQFNNSQTGDILDILSNGATVVTIHDSGVGNFSTGSVRLRILSSTSDSGDEQDVALYAPGGAGTALYLYVYIGAATPVWQPLTFS